MDLEFHASDDNDDWGKTKVILCDSSELYCSHNTQCHSLAMWRADNLGYEQGSFKPNMYFQLLRVPPAPAGLQ